MANTTLPSVTFIIFGAGGDLSTRKILPAIYKLVEKGKLEDYCIVGLARSERKFSDLIRVAKKFVKVKSKNKEKSKQIWDQIKNRSIYIPMDFNQEGGYQDIRYNIQKLETKYNKSRNRVFYLATMPTAYQKITKYLAKYELAKNSKRSFARIAYEKPFGTDQISAKKINKCINNLFSENQVYRVDHYLGKELVGNIALLRFTNQILLPVWSKKHIQRVDIVMNEDLTVENRGNFYDQFGALKDVVQNHLFQLLALTAMGEPKKLSAKYIRDEKVKVLKKVKIKSMDLGQYIGYKKTPGVQKSSNTNTFADIKLNINNSRWEGVPFFIRTGKGLKSKETYIDLKFKQSSCLLQSCPRETNHLRINIFPDPSVVLNINSKIPGNNSLVTPVSLKFSENVSFGQNTPKDYENILQQIIIGDQSAFVRRDEVEASWKIIDLALKKHRKKLLTYKVGSNGPKVIK